MSHFDSMSRRQPPQGDGIAGAPVIGRVNDLFRDGVKPAPAVKSEPPAPRTLKEKAGTYASKQEGSVSNLYDTFFTAKTFLLGILAVMSVGVAGQITLTTRIVDNSLINGLLGIATAAGMCFGLYLANKIAEGLRAGAFVGLSKGVAFLLLCVIAYEEVATMMAKVDPASAAFYMLYVGPICLAIYGLGSVILGLMKPEEMAARKIQAVKMRTEKNQALREIREPERREKAAAKADAMGAFVERVARTKVVVIAFFVSLLAGWGEAKDQAVALARAKRRETGKHIEGYTSKKTTRTRTTKK